MKQWLQTLAPNEHGKIYHWFFLSYLLFATSQFFVPSNLVYSLIFYLGLILPCGIFYVRRHPLALQVTRSTLARAVLALMAYTILHAILFDAESDDTVDTLRHTVSTLIFILCTALWFSAPQPYLTKAYCLFMWLIIIAGIGSIIGFYITGGYGGRLQGLGQTDHAILGANIYTAFVLFGFYFLHSGNTPRQRLVVYAAIAVTALLILLTQSRGPLLSFLACIGIGLLLTRHYRLIAFGTVVALLLCADFYQYYATQAATLPLENIYEAIMSMFGRESHRTGIWAMAADMIAAHPFKGYGMQASFDYNFAGVHPHNLFISSWYYAGISGCIILVSITLYALAIMLRRCRSAEGTVGLLLVLHAILACMTDQGQYVNSPAPLWGIFWMPIGYVMAQLNTRKECTE